MTYNIMKNKNFKNFTKSLSYYDKLIPEKIKKYYNSITSLYEKRIIESKASVTKMLDALTNKKNYKQTPKKIQNIIDFVDSTKHRRPENKQEGIKFVPLAYHEPVQGIKEKNEMREFFITAEVKRYVSYLEQRVVNKGFKKIRLNGWSKWYDEVDIRTKKELDKLKKKS